MTAEQYIILTNIRDYLEDMISMGDINIKIIYEESGIKENLEAGAVWIIDNHPEYISNFINLLKSS